MTCCTTPTTWWRTSTTCSRWAPVTALFAGFYYWFPKMSGRMHSELLSHVHFWVFFIGVNLIFFPHALPGSSGHAAPYSGLSPAFEYWNHIDTIGYSMVMASSLIIWFVNIAYRLVIAGKKAEGNYWGEGATTLEWTLSSPPPFHQYERCR